MKEVLKNIAVLFVLGAFLVSASGFRLIRHTCPSCNIVEYSFHQPEYCCGGTTPVPDAGPVSCCTVPEDPSNCNAVFEGITCCEYESQYYVVDEVISPQTLKVEAQIAIIPLPDEILPVPVGDDSPVLKEAFLHPPPPAFTGTDYLVFLQQLKITFC